MNRLGTTIIAVTLLIASLQMANTANAQVPHASDCVSPSWGELSQYEDRSNKEIRFRNRCSYGIAIYIAERDHRGRCTKAELLTDPGDRSSWTVSTRPGGQFKIRWCAEWRDNDRERATGYKSCDDSNLPRCP